MTRALAAPLAIMTVLLGVALWRGVLGPGILLWMAMSMAILAIRAPFQAAQPKTESSHIDLRERLLLFIVQAGGFFVPALWILTPLLTFADRAQPVWSLAVGVCLSLVGLWLFWRAHADLGRQWSVSLELREGHGLVTGGVYARMRHPMYTAIYLVMAAQAFLLPNWIAGLGALAGFWILYLGRIGREEAMMRERFAEEWDAYAARTPRLIPGLGARP